MPVGMPLGGDDGNYSHTSAQLLKGEEGGSLSVLIVSLTLTLNLLRNSIRRRERQKTWTGFKLMTMAI